jgi:hypothetical protein
MAIADEVQKELKNIFQGKLDLKKFYEKYSSSGGEDRQVDPFDYTNSTMVVKQSNSRIKFIPRIKSKQERNHLANATKEWVEENKNLLRDAITPYLPGGMMYEIKIDIGVKTGSGSQTVEFALVPQGKKNATFSFWWQGKGLSNGAAGKRTDPHELMTACLILNQERISLAKVNGMKDEARQAYLKEVVDKLASTASKVEGSAGLDGFYCDKEKNEPDLVNLAKAISISNYVINQIGRNAKVQTVWQTGTKWAQEIKRFNVGPETMKNYNSSDIIVKFDLKGTTHYWGLSLKKRGINEVEPTLLNKPLLGKTGFISKSIPPAEENKIQVAKKKFFTKAIQIKLRGDVYKNNIKIDDNTPIKTILKVATELFSDKEKGDMLRGYGEYSKNPNIYFKEIDRVFLEKFDNNEKFFKEFLDTIFKIDLTSYLKGTNFHFSLITGEGDYKSGKLLQVKAPLEKEGRLTTEIFTEMFGSKPKSSKKYVLEKPSDKKQAFEPGSTAAKLFYIMKIEDVHIVDLEVRYKGAMTSEPQFQIFMSTRPNNFSQLYKKLSKKKKFGEERWG